MTTAIDDFAALEKGADSIIERSLSRSTLVQPTPFISGQPDIADRFQKAASLYRAGAFREAKDEFSSLALKADGERPNAGLTARINAAACAAASQEWQVVIDLLAPTFSSGRLYGNALWNLTLAWYKLGLISDALNGLEIWVNRAYQWHRARGFLLIAAISEKGGDTSKAKEALQRAYETSADYVSSELQRYVAPVKRPSGPVQPSRTTQPALASVARDRLLSLLQPKRPERRPELNLLLPSDDVETFTSAIEEIAEQRIQAAKTHLIGLQARYPNIKQIDFALAACEVFLGSNEKARDILLPAMVAGAPMPGSALWNLACAQVRLGDFTGTRDALIRCSETEYKTKGQLWIALGVLTPSTGERGVKDSGRRSGASLRPSGPKPVSERRYVRLEQLIRPRKLPASYKPDIGKLTIRDRQAVEQILRDARQAEPANAQSMLVPWVIRYPGIYTIQVHAAAFALFADDLDEASKLLRAASELRALDPASRMNLAYLSLRQADYLGVVKALEGGENSTMAEASEYWLAVSVARAIANHGDPSAPAARALALVATEASRGTIQAALAECEVTPAVSFQAEPPAIAAARAALAELDRGDLVQAAECLNQACGDQFERVGEIGPRVFDPQLERLPDSRWGSELTAKFLQGVESYEQGNFVEAADHFRRLESIRKQRLAERVAVNLVAALVRAGERREARSIARRRTAEYPRPPWQLIYNHALSQNQNDYGTPTYILRRLAHLQRGLSLTAAFCKLGINSPFLRDKLGPCLDHLRQSTVQPSLELRLALAWAELVVGSNERKARSYIKEALEPSGLQTLTPPAEANTMQQVRTAYQQLSQTGKYDDAVQYLNRVIETRETERSEQPSRNADRNLSVELAARECLVTHFVSQGKRTEAVQMLDRCELLLLQHANAISPGFLAKDWLEISKLSLDIGLPYAALRRAGYGLRVDAEAANLKTQYSQIESAINPEEASLLTASFHRLMALCRQCPTPLEDVAALSSALEAADLLKLRAPLTFEGLTNILASIRSVGDGDFETEERTDQIAVFGRAELPAEANVQLSVLLAWLSQSFAKEQPRNPVDVEIYDDRLWPRSFETQACGLLVLNPVGHERCDASVYESGKTLWQGTLEQGRPHYLRWVAEREDGFAPDDQVDTSLVVRVSRPSGFPEYTLTVSASVASSDAVWPDYPTGALDPKDVQGGELYGRTLFIKKIVNSFGQSRSQATYLIEGVRQMGKTSLLKFIRQNAPKHILPVYVNLESVQSDPEKNVWNVIIEQILRDEEVAERVPFPPHVIEGKRHGDLVSLAKELCNKLGKSYVLLLMDELHVLLSEVSNPKGVLADFRTDLNETSNKISLLLADRYTLAELERQIESEYWLQLTPQALGPLDFESTKNAIEVPCQGTDIRFLPEAIERIYYWTRGYPFHVQRLVQNVLASDLDGPWVTVLAKDVEGAVPSLLNQDRLFQDGLCRRDRMDPQLQAGIAAVLEWSDLVELFPALSEELEWHDLLKAWEPHVAELIAGLGDPDEILSRLVTVGVMRHEAGRFMFFSPVLEKWLHKMRNENRGLLKERGTGNWGLSPDEEVGAITGTDWTRMDAELSSRCQKAGVPSPLRLKASPPESWAAISRPVTNREDFQLFLNTGQDVLVEAREDKRAMLKYPWLLLAYHRLRLVRNAFVHGSGKPSIVAIKAWDQVYFRAIGRQRAGGEPTGSDEWRAVQLALLRAFHIGFRNAIAIAGEIGKRAASA